MKRTFTAAEKSFVFDSWKNGIGFSDIAGTIQSALTNTIVVYRLVIMKVSG
jgi:hypothetical protein